MTKLKLDDANVILIVRGLLYFLKIAICKPSRRNPFQEQSNS